MSLIHNNKRNPDISRELSHLDSLQPFRRNVEQFYPAY
jgi:hypothetical protein